MSQTWEQEIQHQRPRAQAALATCIDLAPERAAWETPTKGRGGKREEGRGRERGDTMVHKRAILELNLKINLPSTDANAHGHRQPKQQVRISPKKRQHGKRRSRREEGENGGRVINMMVGFYNIAERKEDPEGYVIKKSQRQKPRNEKYFKPSQAACGLSTTAAAEKTIVSSRDGLETDRRRRRTYNSRPPRFSP